MSFVPALPNCLIRIDGTYKCAWIVTAYSNGYMWVEGLAGHKAYINSTSVCDLRELPEQSAEAASIYSYLNFI